jgi:hypothetical protein
MFIFTGVVAIGHHLFVFCCKDTKIPATSKEIAGKTIRERQYPYRPAGCLHDLRLAPHLLEPRRPTPPLHQDRLLQIKSANTLTACWQYKREIFSKKFVHFIIIPYLCKRKYRKTNITTS